MGGIISTSVGRTPVVCSAKGLVQFDEPNGLDCVSYFTEDISGAGGSLLNPTVNRDFQVRPVSNTDDILATLGFYYKDRWPNLGITLSYSIINVLGALALYWLLWLPKKTKV
ncbi:hypothetical protein BJ875DRAFT_415179 [Amylocarpus encephaloides]|uniref:CDR ABC transporter domain-containing protein n=1 Tax=Amylocarpus encephaloides TaxID=45428 RepID=A0A9P7YS79_9HELO|nr:hypothetical protein BJ875DRAFT_415179 [Amylocarpus encephaloides]